VTRITAALRDVQNGQQKMFDITDPARAVEQRQLLREAVTKLSKAHWRWLKRLATGKIPDHLWPIGVDARGRLRIVEPGQRPPPITVISEAEARERGLYIQLVKWLPGNMSRPHFHPNDRFITVLKGTWWVGTGTKYDPASTVPMPAGSFVTHFGKQVHYDGAKGEETVLLIVGDGPATITPAEDK
jgi:quercetin dioxygenase-like cupin family protein